jgi:hypothetical protein
MLVLSSTLWPSCFESAELSFETAPFKFCMLQHSVRGWLSFWVCRLRWRKPTPNFRSATWSRL